MNTIDSSSTPILLIIFNRPETTKQLVEALGLVKPTNIYVIADGARPNKLGEKEKCEATRKIIDEISWPCNLHKKYFEENHGCDPTVEAGVSWLFENEKYGIILEDDCIPDQTFFTFTSELLEKYEYDETIMHINGSNFQNGRQHGDGSYYFSCYAHSWGWATWQRAWQHYDSNLSSLPEFKKNRSIDTIIKKRIEKRFWLSFFQKLYERKFPFWDSRWVYSIWANKGICITPNQNLIRNIGWGKDATHTSSYEKITNQATTPLFEVVHPNQTTPDENADIYTFWHYYHRSFWQKLMYKIRQFIK